MNLHIKTEGTIKLEHEIWKTTNKQGVFGCLEVTIGWYGRERVDYMTYDTKGVWRCFEIKVSKSDFHSKAHNTFVGNYNYYVMPKVLYDEVKDEIPNHVGVWADGFTETKMNKVQRKLGNGCYWGMIYTICGAGLIFHFPLGIYLTFILHNSDYGMGISFILYFVIGLSLELYCCTQRDKVTYNKMIEQERQLNFHRDFGL